MQGAQREPDSPRTPLDGHPRYEMIRNLNQGSYGFVQLARDRLTKELVAIKFMKRGDTISKYVARELANHSLMLHPHIIQFKEVFLTQKYLAIAMEYADGGDMFQHVKNRQGLHEHEARWFFQQLITGLDYCHKMGVYNRDIKLENTLLDNSRRPLLKICDFGYSKNEKDSLPVSKVGTPGYTAPEIIQPNKGLGSYDGAQADVWSAGVQLYVMLFCQYPFERAGDEDNKTRINAVLQRIINVDFSFPGDVKVSKQCKDLMQRILVADPHKRLTIQQIQQHPWYLKDLPPGLNTFNDNCLRQQQARGNARNIEGIEAIVREAKKVIVPPGTGPGGLAPWAETEGESNYDVDYDAEFDDMEMADH